MSRPVALVTGVGRRAGIGAAIALRLASDGWDVATSYWSGYDARMPWGADDGIDAIQGELQAVGARSLAFPADLADPAVPEKLVDTVTRDLGPVTALVLSHAESVDSSIADTTVESFDRHMAVNTRATWLLIRAYAHRFSGEPGTGRIVALTSDHTVHNLPYGASKGALDRIVIAAAAELADLRISANVVNPGPNDTGWMDEELKQRVRAETPLGRLGTPQDTASLVAFLCSADGGWVNGQLIRSDGGVSGG